MPSYNYIKIGVLSYNYIKIGVLSYNYIKIGVSVYNYITVQTILKLWYKLSVRTAWFAVSRHPYWWQSSLNLDRAIPNSTLRMCNASIHSALTVCLSVTRFSDVAKFTTPNTIFLTVAISTLIRNCRCQYTLCPHLCVRITWKNVHVVLRKVMECLLQILAGTGLGVITFLLSLTSSALVITVAVLCLRQLINWFN